jgi:hypothetical protein
MALNYVDWSGDKSCEASAKKILRETTEISVQDLQWRDDFKSYLNKYMPATVQQAGTLYALRESVRRGVAKFALATSLRPAIGRIPGGWIRQVFKNR